MPVGSGAGTAIAYGLGPDPHELRRVWPVTMCRVGAVGLVAVIAVACGNGSDDRDHARAGDPANAGEASTLGPSGYVEQVAGLESVLVIDGETRATEVVAANESATSVEVRGSSPVPGDGPLINITGMQVSPDRWVVAGNDCDTVETADPAGCSPGTLTLAILEGDRWVEVEDLPADFTGAFVSIRSAGDGRVLLVRWDRGDSRYWLLDLADHSVEPVAWTPRALELGDEPVVDVEMNAGGQSRTECLVEDRLVVVHARQGAVLEARITVVDISRPDAATVVTDESVTAADAMAQMPLVCRDGHAPYLIATGADGAPLAYEVLLDDATLGPVLPSGLGGPLSAITFGPGTVAVQHQTGPASPGGTVLVVPDGSSPEHDSVPPTQPAARVAVFRDGRWRLVGTGAGVTSGDAVLPLGDPALLVVATGDRVRDTTYRLIQM